MNIWNIDHDSSIVDSTKGKLTCIFMGDWTFLEFDLELELELELEF